MATIASVKVVLRVTSTKPPSTRRIFVAMTVSALRALDSRCDENDGRKMKMPWLEPAGQSHLN